MTEIFQTLANKVDARDVIYFLVIICLFLIIAFQERSFVRKDNQFEKISSGLISELHEISNQLTQLTAIVDFLTFREKYKENEKSAETNRAGN